MTPRTTLLVWLFALGVGVAAARADPPADVVRVQSGALHGMVVDDAVAFEGIPYAAPPVGALRWRPPQPPANWSGGREATAFGPVCPQTAGFALPAGAVQSEDCLTLNVWKPPKSVGAAPVMVWLHGGGDDAGTASQPQFDGAVFARDGIVFVSVEYRLGALGWFAHPALSREAAPGQPLANYGLMDQIAALQWVKRNISAFGGDPTRVTVAGESAGGEAVLFLMTTPAAKGLFSQAIVESGTGWGQYEKLSDAEKAGEGLAKRAGAADGADAAALRALPVSALVAANSGGIGVAVDGRLLVEAPADGFATGRSARVPLLIGSNSGEDSLLGDVDPKTMLSDFTPDQLAAFRKAYGDEAPDDATLGRDLFRDQVMGAPARWIAARHAARAPSYLYQFAYIPQILRRRWTRLNHGVEMLFAFAALSRAPRPLPAFDADTAEMTLVHGCWVAFVKTGVPACPGGPAWPAYTPDGDQLMLFGDTAEVRTHFRKVAYDLLDSIEATGLAEH